MLRGTKVWLEHYSPGVPSHVDYPKKSLSQCLDESVKQLPDNLAIIFGQERITYAEFGDKVNRLASALADLGIKKGDRVGLMGPNCPQWEIAFFAVAKLGAIVVQTNPMYVEREIIHQMNDSGATTIIVFDALYPRVRSVLPETSLQKVVTFYFSTSVGSFPDVYEFNDLLARYQPNPPHVDIDPQEDIAVLQYTGGTTGIPKGAMLTHYNLVCNVYQVINWSLNIEYGKESVLVVIPSFHVYDITNCVNWGVIMGATQIILPRFDTDEVLQTIKAYQPAIFPAVPTIIVALLSHPRLSDYQASFAPIKIFITGSAPTPVEVFHKFEAFVGAGKLIEGLGISEASPSIIVNPLGGSKIGSAGVPFPDTDALIVDLETGTKEMPVGEPGEIIVRGPQVMKGYWNNPAETAVALRDGWLYTGDIGKRDEEGYFYVIDRKKDMIIAGGFNVYPRDIEEVLYEHSKVREAVVVGVPDAYRGETVKAYIVLRPGVEASEQEFIEYCRTKLAAFKTPTIVEFRDTLPRTIVGKVLRRQLLEEEKAKIAAMKQVASTSE